MADFISGVFVSSVVWLWVIVLTIDWKEDGKDKKTTPRKPPK